MTFDERGLAKRGVGDLPRSADRGRAIVLMVVRRRAGVANGVGPLLDGNNDSIVTQGSEKVAGEND